MGDVDLIMTQIAFWRDVVARAYLSACLATNNLLIDKTDTRAGNPCWQPDGSNLMDRCEFGHGFHETLLYQNASALVDIAWLLAGQQALGVRRVCCALDAVGH
jgi:hypothetical protein